MINGGPHWYDERTPLFLDLEFDGHPRDPTTARIVRAVASYKGVYSTFTGDPVALQRLASFVASECDLDGPGFLVAHNAKVELGWLKYLGLELRRLVVYDTMLGEWVLRAGLPAQHGALSLDGMATRRSAGVKDEWITMLFGSFKASDLPEEPLKDHCLLDVALTESSYYKQKQELKAKELLPIQYSRSMLTPMLADMEFEHLLLDKALVDFEYQKARAKREELAQKLYTLTGGINMNSPKQKAAYVYDKLGFQCTVHTDSGARSTSEDALASLTPETPEQEEFFSLYSEYVEVNTLLTKNLEYFWGLCDENNCRMDVVLRQGTTTTHRLSSNGVPFKHSMWKDAKSAQGQNIPRTLKKLFTSPPGYKIGEVDGSALEFRVGVSMSGDPVGLREIVELYDIHSATAEVYKCSRQDAKPRTFKPMYGGTGGSPKDKEYSKFFRKKYAVLNAMQERWVMEALANKKLRSPFGLVYNFPNISVDRKGYVNNKRDVYNFPIQGGATGEIIPIAMAYIWHNAPPEIRLVLQVHDSVVGYVKDGCESVWEDLCIRAMTIDCREFLKRVYGYDLGEVELGIGSKLSDHWGQGEERSFQTTPSGVVHEIVKVDGKKQKVPYSSGGK